jgi:hypothetical protein
MTSPLQQKIKITGPSMVTANRTSDGIVIYRTAQQGWSAKLAEAAIVRTSDEARALLAEANADDVGAVGAYYRADRTQGQRRDQTRQSSRTHPVEGPHHRPASGLRLIHHTHMTNSTAR